MPVQGVADFIGDFFSNGIFEQVLIFVPELLDALFGFDGCHGFAALFVVMGLDTGRTFRQGVAALAFTKCLGLAAGDAQTFAQPFVYPVLESSGHGHGVAAEAVAMGAQVLAGLMSALFPAGLMIAAAFVSGTNHDRILLFVVEVKNCR